MLASLSMKFTIHWKEEHIVRSVKPGELRVVMVGIDALAEQGGVSRIVGLADGWREKIGDKRFEGRAGEWFVHHSIEGGLIGVACVQDTDTTITNRRMIVRDAVALGLKKAESMQLPRVSFIVDSSLKTIGETESILAVIQEALFESQYTFNRYLQERPSTVSEVWILGTTEEHRHLQSVSADQQIITESVAFTRDLVNTTSNHLTPTVLANVARELATTSERLSALVYDADWAKEQGMGAYLAVAQGSEEPPAFIHLVYKPELPKKKIALVGKGVTFDSGGLSLKPSNHMDTMKCDMAGAGTVLGVMKAVARLGLNVEVHGYIAGTENMPSGKAIRPGDVVTSASGKTIEILNTDAEGRLTLADALWYAQKESPDHIIDLATLTGACVVALGEHIGAMMTDDDVLAKQIELSASKQSEYIWRLPLHAGYSQMMKSDIADLRNISKSSYGGAITAGLFLKEFIKPGQSWMHMDIAGPAYVAEPYTPIIGKNATGYAVRTLVDWLRSI